MSILKGIAIGCGILIAGLIALVILIIIIAFAVSDSSDDQAAPKPPSSIPTPTPVILRITIDALQKEYDSNQLAADAKFEGEWMYITGGEIINITSSSVLIDNPSSSELFSLWALRCKFDRNDPAVLKLKNGQFIDVFGQNGGMSFGDVNLNRCSFP